VSISELQELIARYEAQGGVVDHVVCRDPVLVHSVGDNLDLVFPEPFVCFYQTFDYFAIGGDEFFSPATLCSFHARERISRKKRHFFPVLGDGMGGFHYIVCALQGKEEPSDFGCIMYNPGCEPGNLEFVASDFLAFVASQIQLRMDVG
jgi:hypothetical protein